MTWLSRGFQLAVGLLVYGSSIPSPGADSPDQNPGNRVWFDDLVEETPLSDVDVENLLASISEALAAGRAKIRELPLHLEADAAPRIVFLSVSDGRGPSDVAIGTGLGWRAALERAVGAVQRTEGDERSTVWLKLDVVERVELPIVLRPDGTLPRERSLFGVAFPRSTGFAVLPEEQLAFTLLDSSSKLQFEQLNRHLARRQRTGIRLPRPGQDEPLTLRAFRNRSCFFDTDQMLHLYRGHRSKPEITATTLLKRAKVAGDYLVRALRPDGRFVYSYLPKTDKEKDAYNMVRHAGTAYAMLDLWETTRDDQLLQAAERALAYLLRFVEPFGRPEDDVSVMAYKGKIKLGGVALTAVALAEHVAVTENSTYLPVAQRLCRYIRQSQLPNGEFVHQRRHPNGEILGFTSQYYPGEALLALLRVAALDREPSWLDAAVGHSPTTGVMDPASEAVTGPI